MSIVVKHKGNFNKTKAYFNKALNVFDTNKLIKIADNTINELKKATPYDSIAKSWSYELEVTKKTISLTFNNSEIQNGVNLAILTNYGYATKEGRWVAGKHYIEKPIIDAYNKILKETWEELKAYE